MNQKNVFTVLAMLGFGLWMGSEIIEIIQSYNPAVYYIVFSMTVIYMGILGLAKGKQVQHWG